MIYDDSGWNSRVKKSAATIQIGLESVANEIPIRNLLLMDYLEDVLDYILGDHSSPCAILEYVERCFEYKFEGFYSHEELDSVGEE